MITQVVNVSDAPGRWNWLANRFTAQPMMWRECSGYVEPGSAKRLKVPVRRFRAATDARDLLSQHPGRSVVVSHAPFPTLYSAAFTHAHRFGAVHLAFAFNFATLPTGFRRMEFRRYLKQVDTFVIASTVERRLYSEYFGIEPERFELLLWSMEPPIDECFKQARFGSGRYICAIGSQGRDYDTLIEAMRTLPSVNLVLVTSSTCLPRLPVPPNVTVLTDVPFADAMNVLAHSRCMVLPLRDSDVPAGHITAVAALHMGKAIVATDSIGLQDYLTDNETALLVPHHDSRQLANRIELLLSDTAVIGRLCEKGSAFAREKCTEDNAVSYFQRFLVSHGLDA